MNNVQEELRAYLEEKDVNNLFVTLVEAILIEKPSAPVKFIVEYLKVSPKAKCSTRFSFI